MLTSTVAIFRADRPSRRTIEMGAAHAAVQLGQPCNRLRINYNEGIIPKHNSLLMPDFKKDGAPIVADGKHFLLQCSMSAEIHP
jgi:hypothetical protein